MDKAGWFPTNKDKLNELLDELLKPSKKEKTEIHGIIVPHAGYAFSGKIAGKVYSLLKGKKIERAIVFGPSHYFGFRGISTLEKIETPLGKPKILKNHFPKIDYDHSVVNQIPFLQKLNPQMEILPLVVGDLTLDDAKFIVEKIKNFSGLFIFSTDLSHFYEYHKAVNEDLKSIKKIENLDFYGVDACGKYPLIIMSELCKLKKWKPKLVEYKNSGDITGEKDSVVGYASFYF